jgi:predicted DNA-binding transcriptional regulator YafY
VRVVHQPQHVAPVADHGGGDLSGLNAAESQALFLLLGRAGSADPVLTSALRKLVRALPATFRSDAEAAARAVVSDPTGWGGPDSEPPALVRSLQDAVVRRLKVRLAYPGKGERSTERLVDPLGLVDKDGVWYLLASTRAGRRTFRVDRITSTEVTDLPAARPDDFDLPAEWARDVPDPRPSSTRVGPTRTSFLQDLGVSDGLVGCLFGRRVEGGSLDSSGLDEQSGLDPSGDIVVHRIAGYGGKLLQISNAVHVR